MWQNYSGLKSDKAVPQNKHYLIFMKDLCAFNPQETLKEKQEFHFSIENLVLWDRRRSRFAGVRDRWLCLGFLCLKVQIPSTKLQINLKFQYSMTKTFQDKTLFGFSNFGHWNLFDIWDLIFGISISQ